METTLRLDVVKYDGTSSPQLSPGKLSVTVAASARHSVSSPVGSYTARGAGVGVRAQQITIPRPTPTPVAPAAPPVRLHRRAQSMNKSGLASSTGVVNIPIPGEFLEEIRNQRLANVSAPVQTKV